MESTFGGGEYGTGDLITVRVDLDEHTLSFRMNGTDVGSPQKIAHAADGDVYHFAFDASYVGTAVTIVEETE